MSIFKRGRVYWFHFYFQDQHIQQSTKQRNPNVARQIEAAHRTKEVYRIKRANVFQAGFHDARGALLFHIRDSDLVQKSDNFGKAWDKALSYGTHYEQRPPGRGDYIFTYTSPDREGRDGEERDRDDIEIALQEMKNSIPVQFS